MNGLLGGAAPLYNYLGLLDFFDPDNPPQTGLYGLKYEEQLTGVYNQSTASQLQNAVVTWYNVTRLIAMVGLLSVLVYVAIRIIISSTAADKAKYKKMLMDWLVALCLLFILHYIMAFILDISENIIKILKDNVLGNQAHDPLMTQLRNQVTQDDTFMTTFAQTIMYLALVILTFVFTFQYLKRVLYMAFLTMIAPLIALTYPLDKIKDGQAQAFSMWLREYIFNSLIQPVHLLLYCMLVGSAMSLVLENPIYGIVAIAFITPAEKFLRKMFGFEKASTVGQLGAAAGGAMVMNMINKMKQGSGKKGGASGGSGGGKGVDRAPTKDPLEGLKQTQGPDAPNGSPDGSPSGSPGDQGGGSGDSEDSSSPSGTNIPQARKRSRIAGVANALGRKHFYGKDARRRWAKRIAGVPGALALGTLGLAAGVASGDAGKAMQYGGVGAAAGFAAGGGLLDGALDEADIIKRGYLGDEEYAAKQADKAFFASDNYLNLKQKYKGDVKNYCQQFLDAGITDVSKMDIALQHNLPAESATAYATIAKQAGSMLYDEKKFKQWLGDRGIDSSHADVMRKNILLFM